jgi:hypothetical protein
VTSGWHVLTGGEGLAGEELVPHDLHDLMCSQVGDVHQNKRRSMAGDDGWRRPWRRVIVPGEELVNVSR